MRVVSVMMLSVCAVSAQTAPAPPASEQKPPVSLSPALPSAGNTPADPAKLAEPAGGTAPGPPVDAATFVLGAQDQISVTMWDEHRLDGTYTIRPDGMISLPLLNEIKAAGLTPLQLQDAIDKAALKMLTTPRSHVNVIAVHSKHVYFDGDGIQAGVMDLVVPIHLLEALTTRGGFRDFANKNKIQILRDGKKFMTVKYKDMTSGKHPESNPLLLDGDHVIVN
jgi:polysaccharide export outer membrane protein